jgi:hypothetical protein
MRTILLLAGALVTSAAVRAADLGVTDLPRIHAEYKANQARWAREFLDKNFAATMTIGSISNVTKPLQRHCHAALGLRYSRQLSSQANEENQLQWVSLPT